MIYQSISNVCYKAVRIKTTTMYHSQIPTHTRKTKTKNTITIQKRNIEEKKLTESRKTVSPVVAEVRELREMIFHQRGSSDQMLSCFLLFQYLPSKQIGKN